MEEAFAVFVEAFATITLGAIFVGGSYPGDIYLGSKCPGNNIFRERLSGGQSSRGQFSSAAIVWGAIVRGAIFLGGNYHRWQNDTLKIKNTLLQCILQNILENQTFQRIAKFVTVYGFVKVCFDSYHMGFMLY